MRLSVLVLVAPCLLVACGPQGEVNGGSDETSGTITESSSSDGGTTSSGSTETGGDTDQPTTGTGATSSSTTGPCDAIPVPEPDARYDETKAQRSDGGHIFVRLEHTAEDMWDNTYVWSFTVEAEEAAPGTYTVSVDKRCLGCDSESGTEDGLLELIDRDECFVARFLHSPEVDCVEFFHICGGFVAEIVDQ